MSLSQETGFFEKFFLFNFYRPDKFKKRATVKYFVKKPTIF